MTSPSSSRRRGHLRISFRDAPMQLRRHLRRQQAIDARPVEGLGLLLARAVGAVMPDGEPHDLFGAGAPLRKLTGRCTSTRLGRGRQNSRPTTANDRRSGDSPGRASPRDSGSPEKVIATPEPSPCRGDTFLIRLLSPGQLAHPRFPRAKDGVIRLKREPRPGAEWSGCAAPGLGLARSVDIDAVVNT